MQQISEHEERILRYAKYIGLALMYLSVFLAIFFRPDPASADTIWIDAPNGDGAPSTGITSAATWNGGTAIDCARAGLGEISRLDVWADSASASSYVAEAYLDHTRASVKIQGASTATSTSWTGTSTLQSLMLTFDPPVYCSGRTVDLTFIKLSGSASYMVIHASALSETRASVLASGSGSGYWYPYQRAWCSGTSQTGCSTAGVARMSVFGTYATTSASGDSYTFYTATTSPSTSIEQLTTVFLAWSLIILLLAVAVIVYYYTYGRNRPA